MAVLQRMTYDPEAPVVYRRGDVLTHPLFPDIPIDAGELFQ